MAHLRRRGRALTPTHQISLHPPLRPGLVLYLAVQFIADELMLVVLVLGFQLATQELPNPSNRTACF